MFPISFYIYWMKLNEEHFSFRIVIIYFWDKPCQEKNFKSHLNSARLCKWRKNIVRLAHIPFHVVSITCYLFVLTFAKKLKDADHKSHRNIYEQWKMVSDLNMSFQKMSDFFSSIVWVHLCHKAEKFWFWKSLKYFNIFWPRIWIFPVE